MSGIVRTKTRAEGGITGEERVKLKEHAALWIGRIMRTDPIEHDKIAAAIRDLYAVSGLAEPRVVIVPSPLAAVVAGGFSAAIWYLREHAATSAATSDATSDATAIPNATADAAAAATSDATWDATLDVTLDGTSDTTSDATSDATSIATSDGHSSAPLTSMSHLS